MVYLYLFSITIKIVDVVNCEVSALNFFENIRKHVVPDDNTNFSTIFYLTLIQVSVLSIIGVVNIFKPPNESY